MATNRAVRAALLAELDVTPQRLSQLSSDRKKILPMSTEDAVYTIAVDNGIDISKILPEDDTARVRAIMAHLKSASSPNISSASKAKKARKSRGQLTQTRMSSIDIKGIPGISQADLSSAKRIAESAYPILFLFENSLRGIIELVLSAHFGPDWWTKSVPEKVKNAASTRRQSETKDAWHERRGAREIDYVDLVDLWSIVNHQWSYFKVLFPTKPWIESLITSDMNISRRQVAHMNPITADDVKNVEAAFRKWVRQLRGVSHRIP